MTKTLSHFFCKACGQESTQWSGRCSGCGEWNAIVEAPSPLRGKSRGPTGAGAPFTAGTRAIRLADVDLTRTTRRTSGFREFDTVLGGGVVPGSLVLVGGPPGAGKSTLLLQIASSLAASARVVYLCGEESAAQTKLRAQRIGAHDDLLLLAETNLRTALDVLEGVKPDVAIIDSIQTVALPDVESYAGSVTQVRECASALMEFSKRTGCAVFLVGHVTKDGTIAGPRLLEHLVDTVLYFEGENGSEYRIVRAGKNRFGSADEICVFLMHEHGLREVRNPSELFLGRTGGGERPVGSAVVCAIVGSRPVLVEVQALVGESAYGTPRRLAANIDSARLSMIIAILERRVGLQLGAHDVYASVAGGLRLTEPSADLGVALAIASAFRDVPLPRASVAFGELGLSGEVRAVGQRTRRIAEAKRLGFRTIFVPPGGNEPDVITVGDIASAIESALAR
ncbi:MAG TPA: DNA repair protein RadA [Candidatus Baltobacteraceae bacterium]|jgi:DNA repair protein RadA/Sms|nr:DNA repair protein RadA [Candidatus Baltobacteraceae bacterium]